MARRRFHRHRCARCRTIWQHPHDCGGTSQLAMIRCHTCPRCGYHRRYGKGNTYLWYSGNRPAAYRYRGPHGRRTRP